MRDHSCTSVDSSAQTRAMSRLENHSAFVAMEAYDALYGSGRDMVTAVPVDALAVAARSWERSSTV